VSGNGGTNRHPFQVTLDQQPLAEALAAELSETDVSVHADNGNWIVSINEAKADRLVVRVLDATRATLAAQPTASAHIQLDGREYVMRGEDQSPKAL
jgi:MoxR-like ATPase